MSPSSRFWISFFSACGAALAIWLGGLFQLDPQWAIAIAPTIAAALILIFDILTPKILNSYTIRRKLDYRSKYEGVWLSYYKVQDGVRYSGFSIKYTGDADSPFILKGDSYYPSGKGLAEWRSVMMYFWPRENGVDYFYDGRIYDHYDVRGFASLSFNVTPGYAHFPRGETSTAFGSRRATREDNTLPHSGTGFFVDDSLGGGSQRVNFEFVRVTDEMIKLIFGNDQPKNFEVEREFIRRIHEKYGDTVEKLGYLAVSAGHPGSREGDGSAAVLLGEVPAATASTAAAKSRTNADPA